MKGIILPDSVKDPTDNIDISMPFSPAEAFIFLGNLSLFVKVSAFPATVEVK